jgi:hypothetical protein
VKTSYFIPIILLSILLFSMLLAIVSAVNYSGADTVSVIIGSDGTFSGTSDSTNVKVDVQGSSGATGNIRVEAYSANPQITAFVPDGISLSRFIVVTFDMNSVDFNQATVSISYTAADVANFQQPYSIYKYVASTNSYVSVPSTVDTDAKTITAKINGIDDPLFAIGGASLPQAKTQTFPTTSWAILGSSIVVIVLLVVVSVWYLKRDIN